MYKLEVQKDLDQIKHLPAMESKQVMSSTNIVLLIYRGVPIHTRVYSKIIPDRATLQHKTGTGGATTHTSRLWSSPVTEGEN